MVNLTGWCCRILSCQFFLLFLLIFLNAICTSKCIRYPTGKSNFNIMNKARVYINKHS